jgi:hypothetical protein
MKWGFFIILFVITACNQKPQVELISKTFTFSKDTPHLNIVPDQEDSTHYIVRLDSNFMYGFGMQYKLTEQDRNSDLVLIAKGKARTNYIYTDGSVIFATFFKGKPGGWGAMKLREQIVDLHVWNSIYDSVLLPKNSEWYPYDSLAIQAAKGNAKFEYFDLDSMTFTIKRSQ